MKRYPMLLNMIQIATTAFSVFAATNYASILTSISVMQTDLCCLVQEAEQQHKSTTKSLEHLAVGWNTFTSSMYHFTSEIDKRTLQLSNINPTPSHKYTTPSDDSRHTSDDKVGNFLRIIPGYRQIHLCTRVPHLGSHRQCGICGHSGEGTTHCQTGHTHHINKSF